MSISCRTCRYFVPHEQVPLRMENIRFGGECRVKPPVPRTQDHVDSGYPMGTGVFPVVLAADWCGEFRPRARLQDEPREEIPREGTPDEEVPDQGRPEPKWLGTW